VKRHKTMLATAKAAKSTLTVTPREPFEPKFRTVLAPNANWPKGEKK
jgi:hypothetical protein